MREKGKPKIITSENGGRKNKKNLIYLVSDALRPDYIGCYGNTSVLTTEIDKLARGGVLFENVISSAPWTIPSIATHLTGIYPHKLLIFSPEEKIGKSIKTIFQRFKEAGYVTSAYFDSQKLFSQWSSSVDHYAMSLDIIDLLDFISEHKNKNFFIFNLYRGTHIPYVLKYSKTSWYKSLEEALDRIRYGGEVGIKESKYRYARAAENFSEWYLRAILDRLIDEDILDKTTIIVTSDHGESWGERYSDKSKIDTFALHGPLLYNEVLKVPLIVYNLGTAKGLMIKNMIRSVDILPTLLDTMGQPFDLKELDGISLKPCLYGEIDKNDFPNVAFSTTTSYENPKGQDFSIIRKFSVIKEEWKLIWTQNSAEIELYNLKTDPDETTNVFTRYPEVADRLKSILEEELKLVPPKNLSVKEEKRVKDKIKKLKRRGRI
jgi:arylsulfatase A-like enzyme